MIFPEENVNEGLGRQWIVALPKETAIPCRWTVSFYIDLGESDSKMVRFKIWEVKEGVKVDTIKPPKVKFDSDKEEEDIEVKEKTIEKESVLGAISLRAQGAAKEGDSGRWKTKIEVQFVVGGDGRLEVSAWEVGRPRAEKVSVVL